MADALHLGVGNAPWEWIELQAIRVYHCTHAELDEMDARRVLLDLEMLSLARQVQDLHRR